MPSYGEFIVPPPVAGQLGAETPESDVPAGTVCGLCGNHNCPIPGACG